MADEVPDLRPRGIVDRVLTIAEKYADKSKCDQHCRCVVVLRREMAIVMAVFVIVVGALVRREVLSYVPRTSAAVPPPRSGYVLPAVDGAK